MCLSDRPLAVGGSGGGCGTDCGTVAGSVQGKGRGGGGASLGDLGLVFSSWGIPVWFNTHTSMG